jgi:polysaccharide chain length determinant protein (PEP-CTERM system associated)
MVRNGEIALSDVKRSLRRHWWIPLVSMLLLGLLGVLAVLILPKKYTSTTMVLVEQPTVPVEYVKPVVNDDLNHRLASMKEQVLSRSRLEPIIQKLNLYPEQRGKAHMEELEDNLRKAVDVELMQPMAGSVNKQPPGFQISVTFPNPHVAQQICTDITSMFIEQNSKRREQQAVDTTTFLSQQLDQAKTKLDEQDAQLAQFKRQYLGSLPEEEQTNLSILTGMNTQLEAVIQALSRAQQDKAFNEAMLSQQETNWKQMTNGNQNPETQQQQLTQLEAQLSDLLARYTPEHPDVLKVKSQIEELKKKLAQEPGAKAPTTAQATLHEPPQIQQLRAKIKQDDIGIGELSKRQSQIQEQIRLMQGRVQASPVVEQQFKEITRNYQTALELYNELLKKRDSSTMATSLEHQQESETFRILDPPSLPDSPSSPNRLALIGGGTGVGLALGFGILYLLAMMDKAMYTERDVETCLKLPVLTTVPCFDPGAHGSRSGPSDPVKVQDEPVTVKA